ncbi:hypothetical protein [Novipirellula sp.]|uniref:hypothetical protein n=1 Tax=Novipirellula sp. TaxID=2795430 RepID=UPI0035676451
MAKRRSSGPGISFFAFQDIITAVVGIFILITMILVLELAQRVESASNAPAEDIRPVVQTIEALKQQIADTQTEFDERSKASDRSDGINAFNLAENVELLKQQNAALHARTEASNAKAQKLAAESREAATEAERLAIESKSLDGMRGELDAISKKLKLVQERANVLLGDESTVYRDETAEGRFLTLVTLSTKRIQVHDALTRSVKTLSGSKRLDQWESWLENIPLDRRQLLILIEPGGEGDFREVEGTLEKNRAQYGFTVVGADHAIRLGYELKAMP